MAFRWIVSRVIRLFGQKTNALFYVLTYRELQREIVSLAGTLGVSPDALSKEIGKRAAQESAERHANILGLVPINPSSPDKIVKYIETLWYILFGQDMKDYEIRVDDETPGRQSVTFLLKRCPVCMGHEEDLGTYKELYKAFSSGENGQVEGYACLMAGMLEKLAAIIMENKGLDIRMDISETKCLARGDDIMAVQARVIPAEAYAARASIDLGIATQVPARDTTGGTAQGALEGIAGQSTRLFEKISDQLRLDKLDSFFEDPGNEIKDQIASFIEKQLHFKPKDILAYFQNYEEDIFRVIGYLVTHALNEAGNVIGQVAGNFILGRLLDLIISAFEHGLDTFLPRKIAEDNKTLAVAMMKDWAHEDSVAVVEAMDHAAPFKLVLEGVKLALADYGMEFQGARDATWTLLKKTAVLQGEEPSQSFTVLFDIFQEAALVAGYVLAIPLKAFLSVEYELVKTPVESAQDVYQQGRVHLERLFDLIERFQELDMNAEQEGRSRDFRKAFPKVF